MNAIMLIAVAGGGAIGSMGRYILNIYAGRLFGTAFPWGTLIINVTGSFLIGALAESFALRWHVSLPARAFLIVGICGGYTTFSAFSLEVVNLANRGELAFAAAYVIASVVLSLGAMYGALHLMRTILI